MLAETPAEKASATPLADKRTTPASDFAKRTTAQRLTAEVFGTFILVFISAGGCAFAAITHEISPAARAIAEGAAGTAMSFALSNVSGAHFNPATTIAFAFRGAFPWKHVPQYWAAQFLGGILAVLAVGLITDGRAELAVSQFHFSIGAAFAMEVFLTSFRVLVILSTATRHKVLGPNAAIASGGALAACGLFSRPVSGSSTNPARSLAAAVVTGHYAGQWIYGVAPIVGALVGTMVVALVHRHHHHGERLIAMGED